MTVPNVKLSDTVGIAESAISPAVSTSPHERTGLRGDYPGGRDWKTILEENSNITGTPDPYFDIDNALTYLGAFRVPFINNGTYARSQQSQALAFNPPNGSNSANGSLFMGGDTWLGEFDIPTWSTTVTEADVGDADQTLGGLPLAPTIQTLYSVINERYLDFPVADPYHGNINDGARQVGWMRLVDGRLVVQFYGYYQNNGSAAHFLVLDDPSDFTTTNIQGFLDCTAGDNSCRYTMPIPVEHQADFGGNDMMSGICTEIAIVDRSSYGHSLYSWDSSQFTATTASPVTMTKHIRFPSENVSQSFEAVNNTVRDHYDSIVGPVGDWEIYTATPTTGRFTNWEGLPLPEGSTRRHVIQYGTHTPVAFFVPGTDTVLMLGWQDGSRYGKAYRNHYLDDPTGFKHGGFGELIRGDVDNFAWAYNLNDIKNSVNGEDIDYSDFRCLSHWPWTGSAVAGCVDETNNRLYLLHDGYYWNEYNGSLPLVVTVWQINAGAKP